MNLILHVLGKEVTLHTNEHELISRVIYGRFNPTIMNCRDEIIEVLFDKMNLRVTSNRVKKLNQALDEVMKFITPHYTRYVITLIGL